MECRVTNNPDKREHGQAATGTRLMDRAHAACLNRLSLRFERKEGNPCAFDDSSTSTKVRQPLLVAADDHDYGLRRGFRRSPNEQPASQ